MQQANQTSRPTRSERSTTSARLTGEGGSVTEGSRTMETECWAGTYDEGTDIFRVFAFPSQEVRNEFVENFKCPTTMAWKCDDRGVCLEGGSEYVR